MEEPRTESMSYVWGRSLSLW